MSFLSVCHSTYIFRFLLCRLVSGRFKLLLLQSWDDDRTFCRSLAYGADLVVFGSAAEQAAVTSICAAQGNVSYLYDYTLLQCFIVWPCVDRFVMPFLHHPHRSSSTACGKIFILVGVCVGNQQPIYTRIFHLLAHCTQTCRRQVAFAGGYKHLQHGVTL